MTEAQFQAVVSLVREKAEKMASAGQSDNEPWHIALEMLTHEHYNDITRDELVESVQGVMTMFCREASAVYTMTGGYLALSDAIQSSVICVALEMARKVANSGKVLALPAPAEEIA